MLEGMKDFVLTVLFCLPIRADLPVAWGQNLKPGNRRPEVGGLRCWERARELRALRSPRRARRGPEVASQRGPWPHLDTHSPGEQFQPAASPLLAFQAPPAPRPPPQVGHPRQPIARISSTGAVLVPSEVTCNARLASESVEALLRSRLSQLRREKNMARTLEGAKARVALKTEAPAA